MTGKGIDRHLFALYVYLKCRVHSGANMVGGKDTDPYRCIVTVTTALGQFVS